MIYCERCKQEETCDYVWKGEAHSCVGFNPIKTNADKIRTMTDEELATWLGVYCNGQTAQEVGKPCASDIGSCEECWLDWLRQEAKDECE